MKTPANMDRIFRMLDEADRERARRGPTEEPFLARVLEGRTLKDVTALSRSFHERLGDLPVEASR